MRYFLKMNLFSLLAALPLALFTIIEVNVYRLARVTRFELGFWTKTAAAAGWIAVAAGLLLMFGQFKWGFGRSGEKEIQSGIREAAEKGQS